MRTHRPMFGAALAVAVALTTSGCPAAPPAVLDAAMNDAAMNDASDRPSDAGSDARPDAGADAASDDAAALDVGIDGDRCSVLMRPPPALPRPPTDGRLPAELFPPGC